MTTCECGARFERSDVAQACPGCGAPPDADPHASEEPLVDVRGRRLPLRLWESEVLVNAAGQLALIHAFSLSLMAPALLYHCLMAYMGHRDVYFLAPGVCLPPAVFALVGAGILLRRVGWVGYMGALILFAASSTYVLLRIGGLVLYSPHGLLRLIALPFPLWIDWGEKVFWTLAYPWMVVAAYMGYCMVRRASRVPLRPCYRGVRLAPLWSREPRGVRSVRVLIARAMVLLAGLYGTTLGGYLAIFFFPSRLD